MTKAAMQEIFRIVDTEFGHSIYRRYADDSGLEARIGRINEFRGMCKEQFGAYVDAAADHAIALLKDPRFCEWTHTTKEEIVAHELEEKIAAACDGLKSDTAKKQPIQADEIVNSIWED